MADPTTVNIALAIPTRGSDPGTWDVPLNGDFNSIDGMLGGVVAIGLTSVPVTLTAPTGSITPSPGPTQAQNAVLSFTGTLTANVLVTLPLPGRYIVENLTTGNFALQLAGATVIEVVCLPPGSQHTIYNDGSRVRFVDMGKVGDMEFWAGVTTMPGWVTFCTVPPYLPCDGTIHNFSTHPYLGRRLGASFGGNGITTFATPDQRGRVPLAYDGTGTRITAAGCGINGQTMGAAIDAQTVQLTLAKLPTGITSRNPTQNISTGGPQGHTVVINQTAASSNAGGGSRSVFDNGSVVGTPVGNLIFFSGANDINVTSNNTSGEAHNNVQPSIVSGIWVVKT